MRIINARKSLGILFASWKRSPSPSPFHPQRMQTLGNPLAAPFVVAKAPAEHTHVCVTFGLRFLWQNAPHFPFHPAAYYFLLSAGLSARFGPSAWHFLCIL